MLSSNVIEGLAGADTLNGGGGTSNTLSYASSNAGVTVDLTLGTSAFDDDFNSDQRSGPATTAMPPVKMAPMTRSRSALFIDIIGSGSRGQT